MLTLFKVVNLFQNKDEAKLQVSTLLPLLSVRNYNTDFCRNKRNHDQKYHRFPSFIINFNWISDQVVFSYLKNKTGIYYSWPLDDMGAARPQTPTEECIQ